MEASALDHAVADRVVHPRARGPGDRQRATGAGTGRRHRATEAPSHAPGLRGAPVRGGGTHDGSRRARGGPLRMVEGARASARSTHRAGRTARARLQQILATSGKLERPANDSGGVICSAQPVQGGYESIRRGTAYRGAGNARSCRWYTSCTSENGLWSRVYRTA